MTRPLHQIALDIKGDIEAGNWKKPALYAAIPYINAMAQLDGINDRYGCDSGKVVVLYFLSNAAQWKGDRARAIKLELKEMVGISPLPTHSRDFR